MTDLMATPTHDAPGSTTPGRFVWYELMSADPQAAARFYGGLVGWTVAVRPGSDLHGAPYHILSMGDRQVGGILQLDRKMIAGGARAGWLGYIAVADTDAAAKKVTEAGGRVHMPPQDIPGVGRMSMVADPGGAPFYLFTPLPSEAPQPPPVETGTPGHVAWHELYAGNGQEAAFAFYSALFDWEAIDELDMGAAGKYRIFGVDGTRVGGMMDKPGSVEVPAWAYYFEVDCLDRAIDRLRELGGRTVMEPESVPGGSWIVQGIDPEGAHFALVSERR